MAFLIIAGCLLALNGFGAEPQDLTKIEEGVYARIVSPDGNAVGNAGIILLENSILVFDTHFTPEAGYDLLKDVKALSQNPVRYVVNSHAHADHTHGNQAFPEAQIIGSDAARREVLQNDLPALNRTIATTERQLQKLRQDAGSAPDPAEARKLREQLKQREDYLRTVSQLKLLAPFVTLDDQMIIRDGAKEVRLLFLGAGHTGGDIVLYLPRERIAFAGDLFFNAAIPNVQDAVLLQWMDTLEALLKLDADKFIPGHGIPGGRKEVTAFLDYFRELRAMVEPAVERGDSMDQTVRDVQMPAKYASYKFQNFFPSNVQKMYTELKALKLRKESEEAAKKPAPFGK